jgi:hypothetical protein
MAMNNQMTFADWQMSETDEALTIQQQFQRFHEANPWVYHRLREMALELHHRGHRKIGIKMLIEALRWQYYRQTSDPSGWKLNNNYSSRYARLIMEKTPCLRDSFETRTLKSA